MFDTLILNFKDISRKFCRECHFPTKLAHFQNVMHPNMGKIAIMSNTRKRFKKCVQDENHAKWTFKGQNPAIDPANPWSWMKHSFLKNILKLIINNIFNKALFQIIIGKSPDFSPFLHKFTNLSQDNVRTTPFGPNNH